MAKQGFTVVDSELHVMEDYDLWDRRLPEPYRSRTKIVAPPRGHLDQGRGQVDLVGKDGVLHRGQTGSSTHVNRQAQRRWQESPQFIKFLQGNCTPELWLEGMDMDGIDVAILTPTIGLRLLSIDGAEPEHALALCRVYNDWLAEFASARPDRLKMWGWLPRQAPALAAQEARRCVEELGAVGVAMTTAPVDQTILTDEEFEPLWAELDRMGTPVAFHVGGSDALAFDFGLRYHNHRHSELVRTTLRFPFHAQATLAELIMGGTLEQFPNLRVVIQETNATWLPWLLWRMDERWETFGPDEDYSLSLKPSEYFRRQCYAVVDANEDVAKYAIDYLEGADRLLWSGDFPHHDSTFPGATSTFLGLEGISDESKRKILWDNGAELYGLKVPATAR